ncbi:MAG TPA: sugar ABC transporter permease [Candidatus Eisenbacteria bacterium]|nr:sugar ABC transporter permease [Candidatus Eisenbacteria bacterium]
MRAEARAAEARAAWAFLSPALGLITVFFVGPILIGLVLSFTDFDIYAIADPATVRVVGLENYGRILTDREFGNALRNTMTFVLLGGPLSVLTSLGVAMLVSSKLARWKDLFRVVFFAPVVTTLVGVAIVWKYLYHPRYGLIDAGLTRFGLPAIDWLGDPHWAMPAIVLFAVWKNFGYNMLIFVAGLQSIPEELYEAARIDGASGWSRFVHVTLPSLAPTFLFVGVITMIGQFQLFAEPYVMTQGGPLRSTVSVILLMYEQGFRWWRMGYAAAIAFVLLAMVLVGTWIQLKLAPGERR